MMWWPYGYGPGWGWMIGGWITMLVFWALVIIGIVALVRFLIDRGGQRRPREAETLLEILAAGTRPGSSRRNSSMR